MKTQLPELTDYYRPNRARELREKAARLERGVSAALGVFLVGAIGAACVQLLIGNLMTGVSLACLFLPLTWFAYPIYATVRRRASEMKDKAGALEAEHAARYGALPRGEAP